jgi:hypothetical protein
MTNTIHRGVNRKKGFLLLERIQPKKSFMKKVGFEKD